VHPPHTLADKFVVPGFSLFCLPTLVSALFLEISSKGVVNIIPITQCTMPELKR